MNDDALKLLPIPFLKKSFSKCFNNFTKANKSNNFAQIIFHCYNIFSCHKQGIVDSYALVPSCHYFFTTNFVYMTIYCLAINLNIITFVSPVVWDPSHLDYFSQCYFLSGMFRSHSFVLFVCICLNNQPLSRHVPLSTACWMVEGIFHRRNISISFWTRAPEQYSLFLTFSVTSPHYCIYTQKKKPNSRHFYNFHL